MLWSWRRKKNRIRLLRIRCDGWVERESERERERESGNRWEVMTRAVWCSYTARRNGALWRWRRARVPGRRISATRREISCHETFNRATTTTTTTTTTSRWWRWPRRWVMLIQGRCDGVASSGLPSTGPAATRAARRRGRPTELRPRWSRGRQ